MKKRSKILLIVLASIVLILAVVTVTQWNNIQALRYFLFHSNDEVTGLIASKDIAVSETLQKVPDVTVRDLTDEEKEKFNSGEMSQEEVVLAITGGVSPAEPDESMEVQTPNPQENTRLSELLAQVYVLRAQFTGALDGLLASAKAEYTALPESEREAAKNSLALKYVELALSLESQCDAAMDRLLSEIDAELRATGGDRSVVSDIRSLYASEKSLKKAEYLSRYGG